MSRRHLASAASRRLPNPVCDVELVTLLERCEAVLDRSDYTAMLPTARKGAALLASDIAAADVTEEDAYAVSQYREWKGRFDSAPRVVYSVLQHLGVARLFQGILREADLPAALRKKVEAAARFFARSSIRRVRHDGLVLLDAYEKAMAEYRQLFSVAKEALAVGTPHAACAATGREIAAGPFVLVNTGGFDSATMERLRGLVEKAARLCAEKKLARVLYGPILVTQTLKNPRVAAFYYADKDEMFLRAKVPRHGDREVIHTVIHELAHRLEDRFLASPKDTAAIARLYRQIEQEDVAHHDAALRALWESSERPQRGDRLTTKNGTYEVIGYHYGPVVRSLRAGYVRDAPVILDLQEDLRARLGEAPPEGVRRLAHISLEGYAAMKGLLHIKTLFVSPYAKTDPSENFAEMVAAYCLGELDDASAARLEAILARLP